MSELEQVVAAAMASESTDRASLAQWLAAKSAAAAAAGPALSQVSAPKLDFGMSDSVALGAVAQAASDTSAGVVTGVGATGRSSPVPPSASLKKSPGVPRLSVVSPKDLKLASAPPAAARLLTQPTAPMATQATPDTNGNGNLLAASPVAAALANVAAIAANFGSGNHSTSEPAVAPSEAEAMQLAARTKEKVAANVSAFVAASMAAAAAAKAQASEAQAKAKAKAAAAAKAVDDPASANGSKTGSPGTKSKPTGAQSELDERRRIQMQLEEQVRMTEEKIVSLQPLSNGAAPRNGCSSDEKHVLCVEGVPLHWDAAQLRRRFEFYGHLLDVRIERRLRDTRAAGTDGNPSAQSWNVGMLAFGSPYVAQRVLQHESGGVDGKGRIKEALQERSSGWRDGVVSLFSSSLGLGLLRCMRVGEEPVHFELAPHERQTWPADLVGTKVEAFVSTGVDGLLQATSVRQRSDSAGGRRHSRSRGAGVTRSRVVSDDSRHRAREHRRGDGGRAGSWSRSRGLRSDSRSRRGHPSDSRSPPKRCGRAAWRAAPRGKRQAAGHHVGKSRRLSRREFSDYSDGSADDP